MKKENIVFWSLMAEFPFSNPFGFGLVLMTEYINDPEIFNMCEQALSEWLIKRGLLK